MIRLRRMLAAERGIALPLSLAVLFVVAGLAAVAAKAAINANHSSLRDSNVKRAIQAAHAGVRAARYQLNLMQPLPNQCVNRASAGATLSVARAPVSGWCDAQSEDLGGNASYTFRVSQSAALAYNSNGQIMARRSIVSTGTVNGSLRRVLVEVAAPSGQSLFPRNYAAVSLDPTTISNSVIVDGHFGSNGDITLRNTARVNGDAHPGVGRSVTTQNSSVVTGSRTPVTTPFAFSPLNYAAAASSNDNGRIGTLDPWTSPGNISWNPTTRVLNMSHGATLTLSGDVYSFCQINLTQDASIRVAVRDPLQLPLRMYIDSPESCGSGSGMGSVTLRNNTSLQNMNSSAATFLLAAAGSATRATQVDFGQVGGTGSDLVMGTYAPQSTVSLTNSVSYLGSMVALQVNLSQSARVTYNNIVQSLTGDPLFVYHRTSYLECANVATSTSPDSGC